MIVTVELDLSDGELDALALTSGKAFLSAEEIGESVGDIVRRELTAGVDVGYIYRVTYYREDDGEPHGFKMYQHNFMGPLWPHVPGRPRLRWDGLQLRSHGGAFTVDGVRGIVDRKSGRKKSA